MLAHTQLIEAQWLDQLAHPSVQSLALFAMYNPLNAASNLRHESSEDETNRNEYTVV